MAQLLVEACELTLPADPAKALFAEVLLKSMMVQDRLLDRAMAAVNGPPDRFDRECDDKMRRKAARQSHYVTSEKHGSMLVRLERGPSTNSALPPQPPSLTAKHAVDLHGWCECWCVLRGKQLLGYSSQSGAMVGQPPAWTITLGVGASSARGLWTTGGVHGYDERADHRDMQEDAAAWEPSMPVPIVEEVAGGRAQWAVARAVAASVRTVELRWGSGDVEDEEGQAPRGFVAGRLNAFALRVVGAVQDKAVWLHTYDYAGLKDWKRHIRAQIGVE